MSTTRELPSRLEHFSLLGYARRQIEEIAADPALRLYGIALSFVHVLTFIWLRRIDAKSFLHDEAWPLCWPLVPCEALHVLSEAGVERLFYAYLGFAILVGLFFALGKKTASWVGLVALNALAAYIVLLDYRLRLNQHYMAFWVSLTFLFVPSKRNALRVLVVLFYFWAGLLKLNWEWVSGAALYRPIWFFRGNGVIVACAYVVVLELVVVFGLLAKRPRVFWPAFAQFMLFHVMSWPVVGFFYPLLMFSLLTIHPLTRLVAERDEPSLLSALLRGRAGAPAYAVLAAFSLLQLPAHLLPGDRALTGEGRLISLHMFDALTVCDGRVSLYAANGGVVRRGLRPDLAPRERCDPWVYHSIASRLCETPEVSDLDLLLRSRRRSERELRTVVDLRGFCSQAPSYSPFWHNAWILTD